MLFCIFSTFAIYGNSLYHLFLFGIKMKKLTLLLPFICLLLFSCKTIHHCCNTSKSKVHFDWKAANLYFLLTDRFYNGTTENDNLLKRNEPTGMLRGFMGGDIKGVTKKIEEGYFTKLGINAIWLTPVVEQIHGHVNEGTGNTYGFHGYWTKDWTSLDPNFGTKADLKEMVDKAHANGIRVVLDAVINHTGPVTASDPVYPADWVRTGPKCTYDSYKNYIECTLVENLPDVLTESKKEVELPQMLVEKWKKEVRYEKEVASLDAFFKKTGFPRTPRYYIMKWLADFILEFGIDGYRVDTAKHTEEDVWAEFNALCQASFADYKSKNPKKVLDDSEFFMLGEVYGYGLNGKQLYDFGDKKVNYFENGLTTLINFDFKSDANKDYETLFSYYNEVLHSDLKDYSIANYISSHDDGQPFDKKRKRTYEAATKLLLTSGISQIYYGDEAGRSLEIPATQGDATLRSFMNWDEISKSDETKRLLVHYQKLGQFRAKHPAIGAGKHKIVSDKPYVFERSYTKNSVTDRVIIALDLNAGEKTVKIGNAFKDGEVILDFYSGKKSKVNAGHLRINTPYTILLLEKYGK
jgi:alpha-amylase